MLTLAGYDNLIQIHESDNSLVYRARKVDNKQLVILKFLNQEYPTAEQIRRYKQEYRLTCQLNSDGTVKAYALEEWQRSFIIVLEDFGGISLKKWLLQREKLSLEEFLLLGISTAESLGEIHAANIIHKDINSANIVFNPETKEIKIIDFGISTQLNRENPTLKNPNVLEGTLAYLSPEQTGRMNRSLDYRTDFYSLGVTFYELLTKQLPFPAEDALELVHSHLAKQPIYPSEIDPSIPIAISEIVMKLMGKNAEERYQSSWGLKADLETCSQQLKSTENIKTFPLATQDISDRFSIPQKLYGREKEIATLLSAYERVAETGKVELMMVAGYSGIGKSSLVRELYKPITARRGYFISGKFDQFQRNIPYSAIVVAFGGLIGQLLGESEEQLQVWREKLLKALGSNGQIIIDVIPKVELIIGKQSPVPELGSNEAQNRFNLVFSNFIRALCHREHPLTLFIDDLQWADLATLQLIKRLLVEGETEYLLLLGAYRDNEVDPGHPLVIFMAKFQEERGAINQINLQPLPTGQVAYLIGDTLQQNPENVDKLAQLVWQKTEGNPFFVNEFLQILHDEELLQFDRKKRNWQWDNEAIAARGFTDNVVELMVEKLQKLPPFSQEVLSLAPCWGAEFELEWLTWIVEKSPAEIFASLQIALDRGLIFPQSELDENLLISSYKFGHDRIQQAAYALIPEKEKAATHYRIGQVLLQKITPEAIEDSIFEVVNQLNYGTAFITEINKREELAKLNSIACTKAKDTIAYQAGCEYAKTGLSLLGENAWSENYDLTLSFYKNLAELAWLCGNIEEMEELIQTAIFKTKSLLEQVKFYRIKIQSKVANTQLNEAIDIAKNFLHQLGLNLPQTPTQQDTQEATAEISQLIGEKEIEDLANLPIMVDAEKIAIVEIANSIIPAAYFSNFLLYPLLISSSVKLSIQYGNIPASAFSYACYSIVACNILQDVETGVKFGSLAMSLVSKLNAKAVKPEVLNAVGLFTLHRKFHAKETLSLLQESHAENIEVGNLEMAGYSAHNFCLNAFWSGRPLVTLEREASTYCNRLVQLNQSIAANWCRIHWQSILNLLSVADCNVVFQETELLPRLFEANDSFGLSVFYLHKLMLSYLFGEIESARNHAVEGSRHLTAIAGTVGIPAFYFYDSLTALAVLSSESANSSNILQQVEKNQTQLQHQWARYAPMNHQHKVDLVAAEKCRVLGQKAEAIEGYDKAIAGSRENEYIQEEALANELAAKFYLDWGKEKIARAYMIDAHYCYSRWGATAKVKHLEANYPQLFQSPTAQTSGSTIWDTRVTSNSTGGAELDLATVIKSTNAISSEIVLEKLLATLMEILVENAGARRGILILPLGEGLFVEATKEAEEEGVSVLQSLPIDEFERLSEQLVRYVARTRETVVLNNAATEGNFTDDAYIQQHRCKSVACTPLINQNKLQGIVYLENNLSGAAFTSDRMTLLRTLATQAAISLENARLYQASKRFVPDQFLSFLEKQSIVDVKLGDRVEREMTVLFSDIRDFTTISEKMTPEENFAFINEYLGYMEPQIQKYGGFIDKYIGDAIMALFPNCADDAVKGAIAMLEELKTYNRVREQRNLNPIRIGIGLHSGRLMLGTVGGFGRMDGTVIGDAVNLSSRVEGLTKTYGVSLLITHQTWMRLNNPLEYDFRFIERVKAKGKAKAVGLFEVFSADAPDLREAKIATKEKFERAAILYHKGSFAEAERLFEECLEFCEGDRAARTYLERCEDRSF